MMGAGGCGGAAALAASGDWKGALDWLWPLVVPFGALVLLYRLWDWLTGGLASRLIVPGGTPAETTANVEAWARSHPDLATIANLLVRPWDTVAPPPGP